MTTINQQCGRSFSWERVGMLYKFNSPWIRKQASVYLLFSVIAALFLLLAHNFSGQMVVYGILTTVISYMLIFSPLIFIKGGDSRMVEQMVPVSPLEKFIFYMSYLLVGMPLVCYACPLIAEAVYPYLFGSNDEFVGYADVACLNIPSEFKVINVMIPLAAMLSCLYCVLAVRTNRIVKAVIWTIGVQLVMTVAVTAYTVKEAFMLGYNAGLNGDEPMSKDEMVSTFLHSIAGDSVFFMVLVALLVVYVVVMSCLSYRALYRRNL